MSWPPLSAEALEALEAELRLQVSSTAGGDCAVIADLPATEGGGGEVLVVTLGVAAEGDAASTDATGVSPYPSSGGVIAAEADSAAAVPEDPVMATPAVGVLPTSKTQSEGLTSERLTGGDGDMAIGGAGTESLAFAPLSDPSPAVASSSRHDSETSVPGELRGALVPVFGGGACRRRLLIAARGDRTRWCLMSTMRRSTPRLSGLGT